MPRAPGGGDCFLFALQFISVDVCWRLDGDVFATSWTEHKRPPVSLPKRSGLGTTVIASMGKQTIGGDTAESLKLCHAHLVMRTNYGRKCIDGAVWARLQKEKNAEARRKQAGVARTQRAGRSRPFAIRPAAQLGSRHLGEHPQQHAFSSVAQGGRRQARAGLLQARLSVPRLLHYFAGAALSPSNTSSNGTIHSGGHPSHQPNAKAFPLAALGAKVS
jgi:hypothetical protein